MNEAHRDSRFFWLTTSAAATIAAGPYIVGLFLTPHGHLFQGNTILAPGDPNVYYSYIEQARQGAWLMRDVFTAEAHPGTLWQPVWLFLGWLANLLHLSTPAVYALGRVLSLVVFSVTAWWVIRGLWFDRVSRRIALMAVLGASGLGGIVAFLGNLNLGDLLALPPDLWVSEMVPLLSSWASPHFLLVTSGFLFVLASVERSLVTMNGRRSIVVGIVGLVTLSIHPYHLLTWGLFWLVRTTQEWFVHRTFPGAYIWCWVRVSLWFVPALAYYSIGLVADPIVFGRAIQNINLTPVWWMVMVSLGLLPLLAGAGWWIQRHRSTPNNIGWLWVWAIVHIAVIYFPFSGQRRLIQALIVPFALLAVPAVTAMWQRWGRTIWQRIALCLVGIVFLGNATIVAGYRIVGDYVAERHGRNYWEYFITPEYQELFAYIRRQVSPAEPIVASLWDSNLIAGMTARTVVAGHPVETLGYNQKTTTVKAFYQQASQQQQNDIVSDLQACYILDGPRERAYGRAFQPKNWPNLEQVWFGPTLTLYRITDCR